MKMPLPLLALLLSLTSCAGLVQPHPKQPDEKLLLSLKITSPDSSEGGELESKSGIAAAAGVLLIKEIGGAIVNATAKALEKYGESFEASYSKTARVDNKTILGKQVEGTFTRVLSFKSPTERTNFLHKSGLTAPEYASEDVPFGLIAMTYSFTLNPSSSNKSHSLKSDENEGHLYIPKARRLGGLVKDKPAIAISVVIREAAAGVGTNASTIVVPVKLNGEILEFDEPKTGSDWIQSPSTSSFSVQVTAHETGKGKAYAKKAADLLKKFGDKGVEKASDAASGS